VEAGSLLADAAFFTMNPVPFNQQSRNATETADVISI